MSFLNPKEYDVNPEQLPSGLVLGNIIWIAILAVILITLLFKFPIQETLEGKVQIFHNGVPLSINAKTNGHLNLYITDQEKIVEDEVIGFYNWKVTQDQIATLEKLAKFDYNNDDPYSSLNLRTLISSVDRQTIPFIQGEISAISTALKIYERAKEQDGFSKFESSQNQRISSIEKNQSINQAVIKSREEQLSVLFDHIASDKELYEKGIMSQRDFELKKRAYEKEAIEIQAGSLSIGEMQENIQDIKSSIELGKYNLLLVELENYKKLHTSLEEYRKAFYVIKEDKEIVAPISGTVFISDILRFTQVVQSGDEILTIKPQNQGQKSLARIVTGPESMGRVNIGDKVMISLDAFPPEQYGVLYASVKATRDIPQNDGYIFDLNLTNDLLTSHKKQLKPLSELTGMGSILINRTNIFQIVKDQILATKTRLEGPNIGELDVSRNN
tara:strand:+ start:247 stop:1578 length:1332 start_codon:yes stop_codon:yes gene_type:complete